jgi:hypothetical protein
MNDILAMDVDLYVHQQAIDTTTPSGRMIFGIFSALGEYERELIRERIMAGQKRARAQGVKIGRPSKLNEAVRTSVKLLRDGGMGIKEISKRLEIGVGSVYASLAAQMLPQLNAFLSLTLGNSEHLIQLLGQTNFTYLKLDVTHKALVNIHAIDCGALHCTRRHCSLFIQSYSISCRSRN